MVDPVRERVSGDTGVVEGVAALSRTPLAEPHSLVLGCAALKQGESDAKRCLISGGRKNTTCTSPRIRTDMMLFVALLSAPASSLNVVHTTCLK